MVHLPVARQNPSFKTVLLSPREADISILFAGIMFSCHLLQNKIKISAVSDAQPPVFDDFTLLSMMQTRSGEASHWGG